MEIYQPGTKVTVNKLDGLILKVEISPAILYEVAWWSGTSRSTAWLNEFEFSTEKKKSKIGFIGSSGL